MPEHDFDSYYKNKEDIINNLKLNNGHNCMNHLNYESIIILLEALNLTNLSWIDVRFIKGCKDDSYVVASDFELKKGYYLPLYDNYKENYDIWIECIR